MNVPTAVPATQTSKRVASAIRRMVGGVAPTVAPSAVKRRIAAAASGLWLCVTGAAAAPAIDGALMHPDAVRAQWVLPHNAIDSLDIPRVSLRRDASGDDPLPFYRLARDTYFLFGNIDTLNADNRGWNGNAGFIVTDDGVIVVDALGTPLLGRRLLATIRSVTDRPVRYLIVTHNHPDHAYGSAAFQALAGVTVVGHPGTQEYLASPTFERSVAYRREMLPADMRGFAALDVDEFVPQAAFARYRIRLGGTLVDVYNTGAHHSYGDLVVHQPNEGIAWISDLAFNQRTTYMGDGHSAQILAAQDWLIRSFLDLRLMVPGHGAPQSRPFPMLTRTRDYVLRLRDAMRRALVAGESLYEAVRGSAFDDWRATPLYDENHEANANFVYREMEQEYFEKF